MNIPVVDDKVLVRLGAERVYTQGYIHDLTTNRYLGGDDYWVGRIGITLRPNDGVENYFVLNYIDDRSLPAPSVYVFSDPNPALYGNAVFGSAAVAADVARQNALGHYQGYSALPNPNAYNTHLNIVNITDFKLTDNLTLRNLAGYQSVKSFSRTASSMGTLPFMQGATPDDAASGPVNMWTEELQLQGSIFDRLKFTVGSFNSGTNPQHVEPVYDINFGTPPTGLAAAKSGTTNAVYAQGTYDLSQLVNGLSFTGGYRYTWDRRRLSQTIYNSNEVAVNYTQLAARFSAPSHTLGIQYQLNPNVMLFVTNSKGSSSGGFNARAPAGETLYEPEFLDNIEYGTKAEFSFWGVQARTNVSGYYGFYHDVQVSILKRIITPSGPIAVVVVNNAAKAVIKGFEADVSVVPTDWLEFNGAFQYGDSGYSKYDNPVVINGVPTTISYKNAPFVGFSKWKYNVGTVVRLPVPPSIGGLSLSADYAWKSRLFAGIANDMPDPRSWRPAMGFLDLGAKWSDVWGNEHVDASLAATNATNQTWGAGHGQLVDIGGVEARQVHLPRMYNVRLQYSF